MSLPSKQPARPNPPRMPSTIRVRRHESSRIFHFLNRHHQEEQSTESEASQSGDTTTSSTEKPKSPQRPRLGSISPDGRVTGRRLSAVEQLVAADQKEAAEARKSASGGVLSKQRSRATAGHAPQLASVSEGVSPHAEPPKVEFPESIQEEGSIGPSSTQELGAETVGGLRNSKSDAPRFLHPLTTRKTSTSMTGNIDAPGKELQPEKSPITTRDNNRLRKPMSHVSIPTPVQEEAITPTESYDAENHVDDVADYLDVVDPEVGALGYLSNIGNSIFMPNIPQLYDRRLSYDVPGNIPGNRRRQSVTSIISRRRTSMASSRGSQPGSTSAAIEEGRAESPIAGFEGGAKPIRAPSRSVLTRITSAVGLGKNEDEAEFDQHIKRWRDMDEEERDELDEHVRMLLTKKSKFKRGAKGFWRFVQTPMGFLMTLYGFLITFWGTAIMLFIFGWIHVGERKRYWIEICDQILCALFACVGLGFAPFRAVDTYRMAHIAHYHNLSYKRREILGLNNLSDPNDLPKPEKDGSNQVARAQDVVEDHLVNTPGGRSSDGLVNDSSHSLLSERTNTAHSQHKDKTKVGGHKYKKKLVLPGVAAVTRGGGQNSESIDLTGKTGDLSKKSQQKDLPDGGELERSISIQSEIIKDKEDVVVLTKGEQAVLEHHQRKLHASHTFYRYHETATHHAFPLDLLIVIVCLLDCHSLLQAALGGCTWGIKYTHRPTVLTATLISCSLSCNAVAGLIIYLGGRRTKKREEVERRLKIALEKEALAKIERRRARGELPDRGHGGGSDSSDEDQARLDQKEDDKERDRLAKDLGHDEKHLEKGKSDHLEMGTYTKKSKKIPVKSP